MKRFGWIGLQSDPPPHWDLRARGWDLCCGQDGGRRAGCRHVLLCDLRQLGEVKGLALAEADRPAWRLIMLGAERPAGRAAMINLGCAEALPAAVGLAELDARAERVTEMFDRLPRWRDIGPLTLDLFHRDARIDGQWLRLHPREFGLLWRLADEPGERVTRQQFLRDVWRLNHIPETNSVEVHVARLRAKLAPSGCDRLVVTDPRGGYRIDTGRAAPLAAREGAHAVSGHEEDRFDACLRESGLIGHAAPPADRDI